MPFRRREAEVDGLDDHVVSLEDIGAARHDLTPEDMCLVIDPTPSKKRKLGGLFDPSRDTWGCA